LRQRIAQHALKLLTQTAHSRWYGPLAGAVAFVLTLTASAPFTAVLVAALWLTPQRWKSLVLFSSLGGAVGAILLMAGFHHLGWAALHANFPELSTSPIWVKATAALHQYGVVVLGLLAAAPIPQTPGLALAASVKLDDFAAFLALFLGRLVRYSITAWLVSLGSPIVRRLGQALQRPH
jgi:membrane protein YqaA with SNARE-associated domain